MSIEFTLRIRRCLLVMLTSSTVGAVPCLATEVAMEQAVRTALLFNFLKFTEWPVAASPQLQVCIATGDPELMTAMEALNQRTVRGKPLTMTRYRQQAGCDVLYVDSRQRWVGMAESPAPHALTIGGYAGFVADGGMIEIALQEGGVRFDIGLREARRAGLRFYPQLLQLARRIVE